MGKQAVWVLDILLNARLVVQGRAHTRQSLALSSRADQISIGQEFLLFVQDNSEQ
jgi:hypothetical protein